MSSEESNKKYYNIKNLINIFYFYKNKNKI